MQYRDTRFVNADASSMAGRGDMNWCGVGERIWWWLVGAA
jgi:hypothetical protein